MTFFFVLSGLVIALSISEVPLNIRSYIEYCIRRFFRIMPLMIITVSLGGAYLFYVDPLMPVKFLPTEYGSITPEKLLAGYIGYSMKPNPPIWSIFVELVASVLLPFMVFTGRNKIYVLVTGFLLLLFGSINLGFHHHWNFYMIDFFLGVTILWWGKAFAEKINTLPTSLFWGLVGFLALCFYLPRVLVPHYPFGDPRYNLFEIVPVTLLVAIVFYCPEKFKALTGSVFRFLGDISFSLYLTHSLILVLLVNGLLLAFPDLSQNAGIFGCILSVISLPLCLYLANLSFNYIELPFMERGKRAIQFYRRNRMKSESPTYD